MIRDRHHFHFFRRACSVLTCVFLFSCLLTQRVYAQEETEEETFTSEKVGEGVYYTLYENSDGTSTLDYYAGPIRYEDEDSELHDIDLPDDRGSVHRMLIRHGKERILRLLAVKEADLAAKSPYGQTHGRDVILPWVKQTVCSLIDEGAPFSVRDLALRGSDLAPLGYRGREVGEALASLLDGVTRGIPNEKEALLAYLNRRSK